MSGEEWTFQDYSEFIDMRVAAKHSTKDRQYFVAGKRILTPYSASLLIYFNYVGLKLKTFYKPQNIDTSIPTDTRR
jgi:hypothetical protein